MAKPAKIDPAIIEYATPHQAMFLQSVIELGSITAAAKHHGIHQSSASNLVQRATARAERRAYSPAHGLTHPLPGTQALKGTSTLYGDDGAMKLQWIKTHADVEAVQKALEIFADELCVGVRGKAPKAPKPRMKPASSDLATHYKIGDQHLGLYAWGEETGEEDYDLAKSTVDIMGGLEFLISSALPTELGVLVNVGDFLHANDRKGITPGGGNPLDTDGRHGKVARRAAYIMRDAVQMMLAKHERVEVINARGNHDPDAAVYLQIILEAYFGDEPRVKVHRNDYKIQVLQFGKICHFVYHGEKDRKRQHERITKRFRKEIGESTKCYVDNGHIHHERKQEIGALLFEVWSPLTAIDLYHADNLYGSERSITSVLYHKRYGEIGRTPCPLQMIRDIAAGVAS